MKIEIKSLSELDRFASLLVGCLRCGQVIALNGDLGAGKTTLTKFIGKAISVAEELTSPSYAIVNEYNSSIGLFVHADVYRVNHTDELYDIGFDEYFERAALFVIEWAEKIDNWLAREIDSRLTIEIVVTDSTRTLYLSGDDLVIDKLKGMYDDFSI